MDILADRDVAVTISGDGQQVSTGSAAEVHDQA
jgi:hypothetical protein